MKRKIMRENNYMIFLKKHIIIMKILLTLFFKKFKIDNELDFNMEDIDVAKYLGVELTTLRKRLSNAFSKSENYIESVDYVKVKVGKTSAVTYLLNYQCFERLAMNGDSEKSEAVRMYFVKLREFLTEHQKVIYQALEKKQDLKKYIGFECMYFFAVERERKIY